jgi:nucleoside-diphosphate-sugar epimerase
LNILVTSAASPMGTLLAASIQQSGHDVRRTDLTARANAHITACDLEHGDETDSLVTNIDAIVHVGYAGQEGDETALIDYHTRCTYNLLFAAAQAGVERVIHISTLHLYERYEENLTVTENWRPLPIASDAQLLACHLGEITAKEFARDRLLRVLNMRLGFPVVEGDLATARASGQTAAVATQDIALAVERALHCELDYWQCAHLQSHVDQPRFLLQRATTMGLVGEEAHA